MIEQEKAGSQGDPEREIAMWLEKAAEADRKRSGFQDMAAEGLVTLDELRAELAGLEETRTAVAAEDTDPARPYEQGREVGEQSRPPTQHTYAKLIPEVLEELDSAQRRQVYALLRSELTMRRVGNLEIAGVPGADTSFRKTEPAPPCASQNTRTPILTFCAILGGGSPQGQLELSMAR